MRIAPGRTVECLPENAASMGLLHQFVVSTLPLVPRPLMRKLAAPYIAGEELSSALAVLTTMKGRGFGGVLDILGEDVRDEAAARGALADYEEAAVALSGSGLDCYVSIKPTHLGLRLSGELALELFSTICRRCAELGLFARVEMEDHTTTDATLELFAKLRTEFTNVGIVLQSRLKRTPADIDALGSTPVDVRLVKGIYLEPAAIAHTDGQAIRDAYVACSERLFQNGHTIAFATHDEHMAGRVLRVAADRGVAPERHCFEVLLGVQERLWERWRAAGKRVRVYVPYGPEWRSYSQRRLRKNPEILRHVMVAFLRRGRRTHA